MQAPDAYEIFWLGGKSDRIEIEQLAQKAGRGRVVAGDLTLMQSAELMRQSRITLANDSGPVHLASAVDAPICAVYCSTAPVFGFYPISTQSFIVEEKVGLHCRPCGIHGYNKCPRGHFLCGKLLNEQIASVYAEAFSKPLVSDSVTNAS